MSNLLRQLRNLSEEEEQSKQASEVFEAAFIDELEKMGYDVEFLKQAGIVGKGIAAAKSALGMGSRLGKVKGAQLAKNVAAGPALARMQNKARKIGLQNYRVAMGA